MKTALLLLLFQGLLGAFDTLWYHEFHQRLAAKETARKELALHAARDFAYAILFGSLAWCQWEGLLAWVLGGLLLLEICITLQDFVEEDLSRKLPAGERIMHTIMAIIYGAFLANLLPQMHTWSLRPTGFVPADYGVISWLMSLFAVGVFLSGIRDLIACIRLGPRQPLKVS